MIHKKPDLDTNGCMMLVGSVIRLAIQDCIPKHCKIRDTINSMYAATASNFLFSPGKLESFINRFGLRDELNCDYIRRQARDIISGTKLLPNEYQKQEKTPCSQISPDSRHL
jgi:hypothetical protein